jgi:hypothetical protein
VKLDPDKCHTYLPLLKEEGKGVSLSPDTAPRVRLSFDPHTCAFTHPYTGVVGVTAVSKKEAASGRKGEFIFLEVTIKRVTRPEGWMPRRNGIVPYK